MKAANQFPKILLYRPYTDMRKQTMGLATIVEEQMRQNPFEDILFLFCNRRRDILKAIYFDKSGFCLWSKKLDQSKFPWLTKGNGEIEISATDFDLLIDGVDIFKRHKKLNFSSLS